jgi:hypothetical protein
MWVTGIQRMHMWVNQGGGGGGGGALVRRRWRRWCVGRSVVAARWCVGRSVAAAAASVRW